MAKEIRGGIAPLICLVCFLCPGPSLVFAAERKLLQANGNVTTWCIVKPSTTQEKLDEIIEYCCTQPKVDCKEIQAGGMCYVPPNKVSDASVVMNIYYSLNGKHPFDCDFKGSGLIITADPSVGKCIYRV